LNKVDTHLGRTSDGSVSAPYQTPDKIDPSLLVAIPRLDNRFANDIVPSDINMVGFDSWNAYEFSALLDNGLPFTGVLRIVYSTKTHSIVESKSLKLYLNSFNNVKMGSHVVLAAMNVDFVIREELTRLLGAYVGVYLHVFDTNYHPHIVAESAFENLAGLTSITHDFNNPIIRSLNFNAVSVDTANQSFKTNLLRSNCRVTNQPDWADVYINISPASRSVDPVSLLRYIVGMRNDNHFHEEVCELIYKDLYTVLEPTELFVACLYTRRGGIDINPIRASNMNLVTAFCRNMIEPTSLVTKTMRQ